MRPETPPVFDPNDPRYWDERGVEVKELLADPARI